MDIGKYTFEEFRHMAAKFHGYPAPGLLLGGYMVEMAKRAMPEVRFFEVVVETGKCLPDAVQLLTLCSAGNNRMKVVDLGKYALNMFDKFTGEGVRVFVDPQKLKAWPEYYGWFMKEKTKERQDQARLLRELEEAGDTVLAMRPIRIAPAYLGHVHQGPVALCPECGEAYPTAGGPRCRSCAGEAPYSVISP
ncbi:MAG: formylmethanofuran dehydrogenase subunit E family protein [Desulfovibrio sp.]|jgi:formylmethanofuran dehydrogenase subunit E|nr:formylmethanofuran dehydrogenase subunit E family protein [Desulfovibrio sp.]